jgi:Poly(R)-hydroxyalkanoic acid synthase subunit (PHA_synth_III_E)
MSAPFTSGPFRPEAMFAGAAAGFYELLKAFGAHAAGGLGAAPDFSSLAGTLGAQFEQWLKSSQAPGLSPGAGFAMPEARASWDLLMRLAQLQAQLGAQWSEIASGCAQRFIARARTAGVGALTPESALKLYELWVDCAEESYAARVRTEEFASLQARLANTAAELLLAQRREAEQLVRAWGLPTREEIEGLERQLRELRERLEQGAPSVTQPATRRKRRPPARPRASPARPRSAAPRRTGRRRGRRPGV